jgi:mRNA-degrading endonuclease RelE of RelBE toxin-antitoxin system
MEIVFHSTNAFEKDLRKLSKVDKTKVIKQINVHAHLYLSDKTTFENKSIRPYSIKLLSGFDSTLYVLRINSMMRVVFAIDDDPLFEQTIITLFRIAESPSDYRKIFASVAESLYQSELAHLSPMEIDNDEN